MAPSAFQRLLTDPSRLIATEVEQLEALVERYPYSANTWVLLALHAELTGHPEAERYYQRAAAVTFDRGHLYDLLRNAVEDPEEEYTLEDSLELLSLEELESPEPIAASYAPPTADPTDGLRSLGVPPDTDHPTPVAGAPLLTDDAEPPPAPASRTTTEPPVDDRPVSAPPSHHEPVAITSQTEASTDRPVTEGMPAPDHSLTTPEPPTQFFKKEAIASREELRERLADIRRRQAAAQRDKKQTVKKFSRRTPVATDGIISATLAEVFIRQGQYQHAIRIYEQLALANPEKRPIFAALIKDLKRKL